MLNNFNPIELAKQQDYTERLARCAQAASDYSFLNLWAWADAYGLLWSWDEELVWIKQTQPFEALWAPVGDWEAADWQGRLGKASGGPAVFIRVPERLTHIWSRTLTRPMTVEDQRGQWDYLYAVEDLVALSGNRLHKKKNLLNQFIKNYEYEYVPFGPRLIEQAKSMQSDWCTWRDCESSEVLAAENRAILRVLDHWDAFARILGGAIFVQDIIVAYTLAEPLTDDTLLIHFEKGSPDYKGVYQAINQLFLAQAATGFRWVNREQDLDSEGLRKAKLSYQPAAFLKKARIVLEG